MPDNENAVAPQPAPLPKKVSLSAEYPQNAMNARKKASRPEKAKILELAAQGKTAIEISRELNVHGHSVNGTIVAARKSGRIPPAGEVGTVVPNAEMQKPVQPGAPAHQAGSPLVQQPVPASSSQDDFNAGGKPVMGASGGFSSSGPLIKYTVERTIPPDGLLGTHQSPFDTETLGHLYGEGQYRIVKQEVGKPLGMEYTVKIGASYGQSRYPNVPHQRGAAAQGRPYLNRPYAQDEEGDRVRIIERPAPQSNSGAEKAIEMMGMMAQKSMDQIGEARKSGPDSYLTNLVQAQQDIWAKRWDEERKQKDQERKDEEAKWDRQQKNERDRFERDQASERERHARELDRIRAEAEHRTTQDKQEREDRERRAAEERKFILELEDKKIALVRQEAEASQRRLEAELTRAREEMKSLSEKTTQSIEDAQATLMEQLTRDRGSLDREHQLREKSLETEHSLHSQMLDIQRESLQNNGGDHIFNTINALIKEVGKGLSQVVDLKRLEVMTPEAQAVALAQGMSNQNAQAAQDGSQEAVQQQVPMVPAQAQTPAPQPSTMAAVANAVVKNRLEAMIQENLNKPFFQDVLNEWALHITSESDPSAFVNMYMQMMQDEQNGEGRQACAAFATFMKPRKWAQIFSVFKDHLEPKTREAFESAGAEMFYEGFKGMVLSQIKEYWDQFNAERAEKRAVQPAGASPEPELTEREEVTNSQATDGEEGSTPIATGK